MLKNKDKCIVIIVMLFCTFINLKAESSFDANFIIKVNTDKGVLIKDDKIKLNYKDGKVVNNIEYNEEISSIIKKIIILEDKYVDEKLFFVESLSLKNTNIWTISVNVLSNDTSVTQFISKQKGKTISGWINRNNKDIFGLRIFNF